LKPKLRPSVAYARVDRSWSGDTAVCVASGPSLTREDVEYCRGRAKVIAVKGAYRIADFADVIYACGSDTGQWWTRNAEKVAALPATRYTLDPKAAQWAHVLKQGSEIGLSLDPAVLHTGRNSGYQAINLAVLLGATRILLLGYDMQKGEKGETHFHGDHPWHAPLPYDRFLMCFDTIVKPLQKLGVEVINCSRRTALTVFPRMTIHEALPC